MTEPSPTSDSRTRTRAALLLLLVVLLVGWLATRPDSDASDDEGRERYRFAKGADALIVPSIGLQAPVIPIAMEGNILSPPDDTDIVGWWRTSAEPGARRGQTVVTGHTVHTGGGVMNRLGTVERGARVRIRDEHRLVDYRATKVVVYSKAELAENAQALFGQQRRDGRLVLVTCTDWDGSDYQSNIVVFAKLVAPAA